MTTTRLEVTIDNKSVFKDIADYSNELLLETLSAIGSKTQEGARKAMRAERSSWGQIVPNSKGKRTIKKIFGKELGQRTSHQTGNVLNPDSMSKMITNYLDEKNKVAVIGGKHKSFRPIKRVDGVRQGYMDRVQGVGEHTHAILHKLNFGGSLLDQIEGYERKNDPKALFKGATYKRTDFMEKGVAKARNSAQAILEKRFALMDRKIDKVKVS